MDSREVHELIQKQFPLFSEVPEAILVCNNSIPGCPVVLSNDNFEKLTLYPRERVIGRSVFDLLHGPQSLKASVRLLRKAITESGSIELELINQRSDGVPFWSFLRLIPLFSSIAVVSDVRRTADFFAVVQRDISLLKGQAKDPPDWSPAEVCMWLERKSLVSAVKPFLTHHINGETLMNLQQEELRRLAVPQSDIPFILSAVEEARSRYLQRVAIDCFRTKLRSDTNFAVVLSQIEMCHEPDQQQRDTSLAGSRIAVKCCRDGIDTRILLLDLPDSFSDMKETLNEQLGGSYSIRFADDDGDLHHIRDDNELETALIISHNCTLTLHLTPSEPFMRNNAATLWRDKADTTNVLLAGAFAIVSGKASAMVVTDR